MQLIRINSTAALACGAWLCGVAAAPPVPSSLPIDVRVAQHGSQSGITNTEFTAWLPPGAAFAGLTGQLSLTGNSAGFSEALLLVGTTADTPASCARRNATASPTVPAVSRLWAGILKNNAAATVGLKVDFTLPHAVRAPPGGACLITVISAGYPYLNRTTPRYATTIVRLNLATAAAAGPAVIPMGIGGEFRIPVGHGGPLGTYVGIRAARPLRLDAIAVSLSAAPVTGAPAGSAWRPVPSGAWSARADFRTLPASVCAAGHFVAQPGNGLFAVLRGATPALLTPPAASTTLTQTTLPSRGTIAAQGAGFQAFPTGLLAPGDCLIAYDSAFSTAGGMLDLEDQSTIYLRAVR
jgi:hypothetical protein